MKNGATVALGVGALLILRNRMRASVAKKIGALTYFSESDFGESWAVMSPTLVTRLDALARRCADAGIYLMISPAFGSLARFYDTADANDASRHNVTRWGECQAADVMAFTLAQDGAQVALTAKQADFVLSVAFSLGFGGVGVYPLWKPFPGFHFDVRPLKANGQAATWGDAGAGGAHNYIAQSEAMRLWA